MESFHIIRDYSFHVSVIWLLNLWGKKENAWEIYFWTMDKISWIPNVSFPFINGDFDGNKNCIQNTLRWRAWKYYKPEVLEKGCRGVGYTVPLIRGCKPGTNFLFPQYDFRLKMFSSWLGSPTGTILLPWKNCVKEGS